MVPGALAVALLTGCAGPTLDAGSYRQAALHTTIDLASAVATAELATRLELTGRSLAPVTSEVVSAAEDDGSSIAESFTSRQPPDEDSRALFSQLDDVVTAATDALTALRMALGLGNQAGVRQALDELQRARAALVGWQERLQ